MSPLLKFPSSLLMVARALIGPLFGRHATPPAAPPLRPDIEPHDDIPRARRSRLPNVQFEHRGGRMPRKIRLDAPPHCPRCAGAGPELTGYLRTEHRIGTCHTCGRRRPRKLIRRVLWGQTWN